MAKTKKSIDELDLYAILDLQISATESEVKSKAKLRRANRCSCFLYVYYKMKPNLFTDKESLPEEGIAVPSR